MKEFYAVKQLHYFSPTGWQCRFDNVHCRVDIHAGHAAHRAGINSNFSRKTFPLFSERNWASHSDCSPQTPAFIE